MGIHSIPDIQHHIRTQQFQELPSKIRTIQRQSLDQTLQKPAKTADFSDIYRQDYSVFFKDVTDHAYLRGEFAHKIFHHSLFLNIKNF